MPQLKCRRGEQLGDLAADVWGLQLGGVQHRSQVPSGAHGLGGLDDEKPPQRATAGAAESEEHADGYPGGAHFLPFYLTHAA